MSTDPDAIDAGIKHSLAEFALLREQAQKDGPVAVLDALKSMPEVDVRRILWSVIVTSAVAEDEPS